MSDVTPRNHPTIKGALFDCDGTLLDSMGFWREQEQRVADLGGQSVSQERLEHLRAMSTIEAAAELLRDKYGDRALEVAMEMEAPVLSFYQEEVVEREGALDLLKTLKANGVVCAVVSASPPNYLEAGLKRTGMWDLFDEIISVDDYGESKKLPGIWHHALERIGCKPKETWGFEDSLYAIDVMASVGIRTVGVYDSDDAGSYEDMCAHADRAVRSLTELSMDMFV